MEEIWKIYPYDTRYEVSNLGQIRRSKDGFICDLYIQKDRYRFKINRGNSHSSISVAKMVWETFKGPVPEEFDVDHINEDKEDDSIENLQLLTRIENVKKSNRNNPRTFGNMNWIMGRLQWNSKKIEYEGIVYDSLAEASRSTGKDRRTILRYGRKI